MLKNFFGCCRIKCFVILVIYTVILYWVFSNSKASKSHCFCEEYVKNIAESNALKQNALELISQLNLTIEQQNREIWELKKELKNCKNKVYAPNLKYETARRRVFESVRTFWENTLHRANSIRNMFPVTRDEIARLLTATRQFKM